MEHDNNPSRTAANKRLRDAMNARGEQLGRIADAKYAIMEIEHDVMKELIKQRRTECLKIDWNRVNRALNF